MHLTFDDGPDPVFTPKLLDVLDALDVRATFFCVGERVTSYPDIVERMLDEGHAVGSHSSTHVRAATLSTRQLLDEVREGRRQLERVVGRPCRLFRPPNGHMSWRMAVVSRRLGLTTWLWTVDPSDWAPFASEEAIADGVRHARAHDVVLLHDAIEGPHHASALDRSATVAAIAPIVDAVRRAGHDFAVLPEPA